MGRDFTKTVKSYGSIISKNISLFLAVGVLHILFSEYGWFPNAAANQLADVIYQWMIPLMISYAAGRKQDEESGGMAAALAASGIVVANSHVAILSAILIGSLAGYTVHLIWRMLEDRIRPGFEMISKNLLIVFCGVLYAAISYYGVIPVLAELNRGLGNVVNLLLQYHLLFLANVLIEPLKIFFFNNWVNHGILIPLGMEQLQETGKSVFFLLETNPGPGAGILLALYLRQRREKKDLLSALTIQLFGGIHEVYFPYVLADMKLLAAVCAGGMAGTVYFSVFQAGLVGPASPGSILTILMLCRPVDMISVLLGVILSAAVSCSLALVLWKPRESEVREDKVEGKKSPIHVIYVVCDAGLGSSAMGAALLRRRLKEAGMTSVTVKAASLDHIPPDWDLIVCQQDFYEQFLEDRTDMVIHTVGKLTDISEYDRLVQVLKEGGQIS